jgi:phage terminase large subunit-like protein
MLFGTMLREDSQSKQRLVTREGGSYSAIGVGGALTGKGADILLIDDPIKGRQDADSKIVRDLTWQWYTSTAYTRLYKDSAIILIQTRWHMDDMAGRLLKQMEEGGEQWEIINLPAVGIQDDLYKGRVMRLEGQALWPEEFSMKQLEDIKGVIGLYDFSSLYQQNPIASENQEFKPEWIQKATWEEVKKTPTRKFLCVDTAISRTDNADSTGLCLNFVDEKNNWHFKAWKVRVNPKQLIDLIFQLHEEFSIEKIGIEETVYLLTIKSFFDEECRKRNRFPYVVPLKHHHTQKETRIRGLVPRYETKSVWHIEETCRDLEEEMIQFPKGKHDDVLDATAYQLQLAQRAYQDNKVKVIPFKNTSFR